jgi:hypothetical protein
VSSVSAATTAVSDNPVCRDTPVAVVHPTLIVLPERCGAPVPVASTTAANTRSVFSLANARSIDAPSISGIRHFYLLRRSRRRSSSGIHSAAGETVQSWKEIRDERNGPQYAVASWLMLAGCAYLTALETGVEVEPMEIARWLTRALAWTAAELAASEDEPQPLLS